MQIHSREVKHAILRKWICYTLIKTGLSVTVDINVKSPSAEAEREDNLSDTESDTTERRTLHAGLHRAWSVCCVYGFVFRQIQEVSGRIPCSALQPTCSLLLLRASGDCPVAVTHAEAVCLFFSVCSPLLRWSRLYCFICESPDSFLHPHFVITSIHSGQ